MSGFPFENPVYTSHFLWINDNISLCSHGGEHWSTTYSALAYVCKIEQEEAQSLKELVQTRGIFMAPTSPSGAPPLIPLLPRELQRAREHEPQTASREIKERNSPGFIGSSGRNTGFCHLPNPQCGRVWAPWSHLKLCSAPQKLWGCNREEMRQRMGKNVLCGLRGEGGPQGQ